MNCISIGTKSICELAKAVASKRVLRNRAFATSTECPAGCWVWVITRFGPSGEMITKVYGMNDAGLHTPMTNVQFINETLGPISTSSGCGYMFDADQLSVFIDEGDPDWLVEFLISDSYGNTAVSEVDYITTAPNVNKSEWYAGVVAGVTAFPNWVMTLVTDRTTDNDGGPNPNDSKVLYQFEHTGQGSAELVIEMRKPDGYTDTFNVMVDISGTMTITGRGSDGQLFGTPISGTCP